MILIGVDGSDQFRTLPVLARSGARIEWRLRRSHIDLHLAVEVEIADQRQRQFRHLLALGRVLQTSTVTRRNNVPISSPASISLRSAAVNGLLRPLPSSAPGRRESSRR